MTSFPDACENIFIIALILDEEDYAMRIYSFYVYIVTNQNKTVLYIGVTNNLTRRLAEHQNKVNAGFTARYNCHYLVYYENFKYINDAIAREKYLKGILRSKKEKLITAFNPEWKFLNDRFSWSHQNASNHSDHYSKTDRHN